MCARSNTAPSQGLTPLCDPGAIGHTRALHHREPARNTASPPPHCTTTPVGVPGAATLPPIGPAHVSSRIWTAAKYQKRPVSDALEFPLLPMPKLVMLRPPVCDAA